MADLITHKSCIPDDLAVSLVNEEVAKRENLLFKASDSLHFHKQLSGKNPTEVPKCDGTDLYSIVTSGCQDSCAKQFIEDICNSTNADIIREILKATRFIKIEKTII